MEAPGNHAVMSLTENCPRLRDSGQPLPEPRHFVPVHKAAEVQYTCVHEATIVKLLGSFSDVLHSWMHHLLFALGSALGSIARLARVHEPPRACLDAFPWLQRACRPFANIHFSKLLEPRVQNIFRNDNTTLNYLIFRNTEKDLPCKEEKPFDWLHTKLSCDGWYAAAKRITDTEKRNRDLRLIIS